MARTIRYNDDGFRTPRTRREDLRQKKIWLKSEYPNEWKKIWKKENIKKTAVKGK